jgi:hypothetical protein
MTSMMALGSSCLALQFQMQTLSLSVSPVLSHATLLLESSLIFRLAFVLSATERTHHGGGKNARRNAHAATLSTSRPSPVSLARSS